MKEKRKRGFVKIAKKTESAHTTLASVPPEKKPPTVDVPNAVQLVQDHFGANPVTFTLNIKASAGSALIRISQGSEKTTVSMCFQLPSLLQQVFRLRAEAGHRGNDCLISEYYNSYERFNRALAQMGYSPTEETKEAHCRRSSPFDMSFMPFLSPSTCEKGVYGVGVEVVMDEVYILARALQRIKADLPTVQILFNALCDDVLTSVSKSNQ